jgi:hypothetical protein
MKKLEKEEVTNMISILENAITMRKQGFSENNGVLEKSSIISCSPYTCDTIKFLSHRYIDNFNILRNGLYVDFWKSRHSKKVWWNYGYFTGACENLSPLRAYEMRNTAIVVTIAELKAGKHTKGD